MITGGVCSAYGLATWGDLFTPRQIIALTTFSDLVSETVVRIADDHRTARTVTLRPTRSEQSRTHCDRNVLWDLA